MTSVEFTVAGEPAPQGSKAVGRTREGRSFVREDNPATAPWRNAVAAAAREAIDLYWAGEFDDWAPPLPGPVELRATFVFPRPKGHYGTGRNAGVVKSSAPSWCYTRPDLDKLLRAVGDAVTGIVVADDSQLVAIRAEKHYGSPCAHLAFHGLPQ